MPDMRELLPDEMDAVAGGSVKPKRRITYTVVEGDTLNKIAMIYNFAISEIREWNNLPNDSIWPNLRLNLFTINY